MLEIDCFAYQSRFSQYNALLKAAIFLILIILALCSTMLVQATLLLILAPLTCYNNKIHFRKYAKWLLIPFSFLIISVIGILLSFSRTSDSFLVSIPLSSFYMGIAAESIPVSLSAFFRSMSCLAVTYLFVLSTPFTQLIYIGKKLRMPNALLEIILLTYRFIFIFLEEIIAIKRAQTLRFGYISLKTSYHSLGMLINMLLINVLKRYKEMSIALEVKLFKGDFHL